MKNKLKKMILFQLSLVGKIVNLFLKLINFLNSKTVFIGQGNIFFKNFNTENFFVKNISHKNLKLKVKINNFWDYWRTYNYEDYCLAEITEDIEIYKKDKKKLVFYEIGANVGYSTIFVAKLLEDIGTVCAFEIEPTNFKSLNDNIIINKIKNCNLVNIGISNKNQIQKFYYNTKFKNNKFDLPVSSMGMHSMKFNQKIHKEHVFSNFVFMKYDFLIENLGLDYPTHIFIDAYGAEDQIIDSILSSSKKEILPKKIMVDIEEPGIKRLENSKIFKKLNQSNYKLKKYTFEKGSKDVPDSFKTIFENTL